MPWPFCGVHRAPRARDVGLGVEVLGLDDGEPGAATRRLGAAAAFHPELTMIRVSTNDSSSPRREAMSVRA